MSSTKLDHRFDGPLIHPTMPASWTVVSVPNSRAVLGTGRTVRVRGTIDSVPFTCTLMPDGSQGHFLSLNAALRKAVGKPIGAVVQVHLQEQFTTP